MIKKYMQTIKIFSVFILFFPAFYVFAQEPRQDVRQHYEKAKGYYEQFKYKEAQEEFQKALSLISQEGKVYSEKDEKTAEKKDDFITQEPQTSEYIIGTEDILYVSVWQNKDLDQDVIVRPDGKVSFPLIGEVQASGITITKLDEIMTDKLKDYIRYPEVSISVKKVGGKKVIVLGEVGIPGVYSLTGRGILLEAIALAGGYNPDAVISSIIIIRGGFKNPKGIRINLNRILNKADMTQNVLLQSDDIIYVPNKFIGDIDYFISQIK